MEGPILLSDIMMGKRSDSFWATRGKKDPSFWANRGKKSKKNIRCRSSNVITVGLGIFKQTI